MFGALWGFEGLYSNGPHSPLEFEIGGSHRNVTKFNRVMPKIKRSQDLEVSAVIRCLRFFFLPEAGPADMGDD